MACAPLRPVPEASELPAQSEWTDRRTKWTPIEHDGAAEARFGLFGERMLVPRYGDKFADEPDNCDDCWRSFEHLWENWNYRVCYSCWWVASATIWKYLVYRLSDALANDLWSFLVGPAQHGPLGGRWEGARLSSSRVFWTRNPALARAYLRRCPYSDACPMSRDVQRRCVGGCSVEHVFEARATEGHTIRW